MSNWKEDLNEGAKTPEERQKQAAGKLKTEIQDFYSTEVFTAFYEIKEALETQDKIVKLHESVPTAQADVSDKANPQFNYFTYLVMADEKGNVKTKYSFFSRNSTTPTEKAGSVKSGANIENLTKDEIASDFTQAFNKVRHQL